MIELPEIFKVMLPDNPYPTEMVRAGDCQTYGDQRAAEAREQMREECIKLCGPAWRLAREIKELP